MSPRVKGMSLRVRKTSLQIRGASLRVRDAPLQAGETSPQAGETSQSHSVILLDARVTTRGNTVAWRKVGVDSPKSRAALLNRGATPPDGYAASFLRGFGCFRCRSAAPENRENPVLARILGHSLARYRHSAVSACLAMARGRDDHDGRQWRGRNCGPDHDHASAKCCTTCQPSETIARVATTTMARRLLLAPFRSSVCRAAS